MWRRYEGGAWHAPVCDQGHDDWVVKGKLCGFVRSQSFENPKIFVLTSVSGFERTDLSKDPNVRMYMRPLVTVSR